MESNSIARISLTIRIKDKKESYPECSYQKSKLKPNRKLDQTTVNTNEQNRDEKLMRK